MNKITYTGLVVAAMIFALAAFTGCKKDILKEDPSIDPSKVPTGVVTGDTSGITYNTATITGSVLSGEQLLDWGICLYSGSDESRLKIYSAVKLDSGKREFKIAVTGLLDNTTYHYKSYAQNSNGVAYGETKSFTTVESVWEKEPDFVIVDGLFPSIFGTDVVPFYIEVEKATIDGLVRYRFKNVYDVHNPDEWTEPYEDYEPVPDENGIYNGLPTNYPGDFDDSRDWVMEIVINGDGSVSMAPYETGVDWSYGIISTGQIYPDISSDIESYPLGTVNAEGTVITFPENSLYWSMANYNSGGKYPCGIPTYIYTSKEVYLEATKEIDYNVLEYTLIRGEISEFHSSAYGEKWEQTIGVAIDIEPEKPDSKYKNLYYLADLYASGYGLAFYHTAGSSELAVVSSQKTGLKFRDKDILVSQSKSFESTVSVNSKGVSVYTFNLVYHYSDGTIIGEFTETFFYSEDAVAYDKADFLGNFRLTGPSAFGSDYPDADMNVTVVESETANEFYIFGIDYADSVVATFDASASTLSIAPQLLPDFVIDNIAYDMTLYTITTSGSVSGSDAMELTFNMSGDMALTAESAGTGYLIRSEAGGGWVDGYEDIKFTPSTTASASASLLIK